MSELKLYLMLNKEMHWMPVYLKVDADKVIAELKNIDSKNRSAYYKDLAMMAKDVEHHKHKRCLAMVQVLEHVCPMTNRKAKWRDKWYKRWLAIAKQFKEAK